MLLNKPGNVFQEYVAPLKKIIANIQRQIINVKVKTSLFGIQNSMFEIFLLVLLIDLGAITLIREIAEASRFCQG